MLDIGERQAAAWLIATSRANNFDKYVQPTDFATNYIIQRGAKIHELQDRALNEITHEGNSFLLIKIVAGINHLTHFVRHKEGKELVVNDVSAKELFDKLLNFKACLKAKFPDALVGFVTLVPVNFRKYRQVAIDEGKLTEPRVNVNDLCEQQSRHEQIVEEINVLIKRENNSQQNNHLRGCRTVSWHSRVVKASKKRKRSGEYKTVIRYKYGDLYDGIHAVSSVKKLWFGELIRAFRAEIAYTVKERERVLYELDFEQGDSTESEIDAETWDFKRK